MPRKAHLAMISERPVIDGDAARFAGQALDDAEAQEHPSVPPEDILAALATVRGQLAETARIANAAIETANQERSRADAATTELDHAKAQVGEIRQKSTEESQRARQDAAAAVDAVKRQAQAAMRTEAAGAMIQQAAGALAAIFSFLVDRAPVLLTLIGAFILARDILTVPSVYQLAGLGIYGAVAVMPAVYLSIRRQ